MNDSTENIIENKDKEKKSNYLVDCVESITGDPYKQALKGGGASLDSKFNLNNDQALLAEIDSRIKPSALDELIKFSLNDKYEYMEKQMLATQYVIGNMAISGQFTVIYGQSNVGKTLIIMWLLNEMMKSGGIDQMIFYVNADDNYAGVALKAKVAARSGFYMLGDGLEGFSPKELFKIISSAIQDGSAKRMVLIFDTVKKYTNLMDKTAASGFTKQMRKFVVNGGTVILLAHVNKHKGEDGKSIYAGTSDLVDDSDCAYTLDVVSHDKNTGKKVVKFENFKSRGNVAMEAVYEYDASESLSYEDRLDSVRLVDDTETKSIQKRQRLDRKLEQNRAAIEVIKEVINAGITQKTALLAEAHTKSGISKSKLQRALDEHTGSNVAEYQYWHVKVADKNAHIYQLNWGVL